MSQSFSFAAYRQKFAAFNMTAFITTCLAACLAILPAISSALAETQIGVTAALRGNVVRTASLNTQAAIGQMSSGQSVFLGDDIKVGARGRMQVMLLDETIFTLGANSVMRIDEFVYDPSDDTKNTLSTSIKQGAFRFVSGQVAKRDANAMTVKLPSATIGVRGTSVAGEVDEDGSAQVILLGPAPDNSLGLPAGAINVANDAGVVDITRPGFVTEIAAFTMPPEPPQQASPTQIRQLEQALSEDAVSELAESLGIESTEIIVQAGKDSDGDGQLDSFAANENLSEAILEATGSDGGVTNDRELLQQVAETLFSDELVEGRPDGEDFFRGINLGEDIGNLLAGDFEYLGATSLAELADFGPTGSITFSGTGADMEDKNGDIVGSFDLSQTWDFANKMVSSSIDGDFNIGAGDLGRIIGSFDPQAEQKVPFDQARGGANVTFTNQFSTYLNIEDSNTYYNSSSEAFVGGDIGDADGNVVISGQAYIYHPVGTDLSNFADDVESIHAIVPSDRGGNVSAFTSLTAETRSALENNTAVDRSLSVHVSVSSFLSNVDRKDGASPTASVGEGMVTVYVQENDPTDPPPEPDDGEMREPDYINKAEGTIFAMKRTVSE